MSQLEGSQSQGSQFEKRSQLKKGPRVKRRRWTSGWYLDVEESTVMQVDKHPGKIVRSSCVA